MTEITNETGIKEGNKKVILNSTIVENATYTEPTHNQYTKLKIFLLVILSIGITLILCLTFIKHDNHLVIPVPELQPDIINTSIIYKMNQVLNYENIENKTTQIKNDNESIEPQKIHYIGNYSLFIYDYNNEKKVYNACAVLFNLKVHKGKKIEYLVNRTLTSNIPLMKVDFKSNETNEIINLEIPIDLIDSKLPIYIYEFIEKIIPDISFIQKENTGNNLFLDKNNMTIIQKKTNGATFQMEDSIIENNINISLFNGSIREVNKFKKSIFYSNQSNIFNFTVNSNFSDETINETYSNRKDFMKELSQSFESKMNLKSNEINEELINKIKTVLNKLSFKKYLPNQSINNDIEKRRLNSRYNNINNKLLSKNQLRNLDTLILDPYFQPIFLDYPLFKSNFVGAKFGLVTKISFSPQNGLFTVELFLKKNNDQLIQIYKNEQYTNFGDIIDKIDDFFIKTGSLIQNDIDREINVTYEDTKNKINEELNKLFNVFNSSNDFSDIYVIPLEKLFSEIKKATNKSFIEISSDTNNTNIMLNQLLNEIKENKNEILKSILQETENNINLYLEKIYEKLKQIYESSILFLNEVRKDVDYELNLRHQLFDTQFNSFDICTFYDIEDTIKEILNTLSSYMEKINEAILIENKTYYNYRKSELEKKVYPPLKGNEEIALQVNSNLVIIEGINQYYGSSKDLAEKKRSSIIKNISSLRGKINEIFEIVHEKINSKYNFEPPNENLEYYDNINETKINLIEYLREKGLIKYDQNFSIYVEDIKSIISIYFDAITIRQNAYQKYIMNNLNEIKIEDNINDIINSIKNTIQSKINNIINEIRENNFQVGLTLSDELYKDIVNSINLNNKLKNVINEKYNNSILYTKISNDYYNEVIPAFNEFNYTFLNQIYKSHINEYISRPTEVENKLRMIQNNEENELNNIIEDINSIIINNINTELKNGYEKINNILKDNLNYFYEQLPKSTYELNDNYNQIEKKIIKLSDILNDISIFLYNRKNKDEFNIKKYFKDNEFKITNNLGKIIDELSIYFDEYVCITNEDICKENGTKILSALDQYNLQIAKLRDSTSFLKFIKNIADEIINESILSNLNETEFLQLYIDNFNYGSDVLISQILEFLEQLNNETITYIKGLTMGIEGKIIDIYNEKINEGFLNGTIEAIAKKVFVDPYDYKMIIKNYLTNPCGPIPRIMNIFNEEIIYYTEKGLYSFNRESYDKNYKKLISEINNNFTKFYSNFLSDVKVDEAIKHLLNEKIITFLNDSYLNFKEKLESILGVTKFEFLNVTFSLEEIINSALNKLEGLYNDKVNELINKFYDKSFEELKNTIKTVIKSRFTDIMNSLHNQYNATYNVYSNKSVTPSNHTINELSYESTYIPLLNLFEQFFNKVKEIYNQETLMSFIRNMQNNQLKKLYIDTSFGDFYDIFMDKLDYLMIKNEERILQEKSDFLSNITILYIKGFNNTIDLFKNIGINYLNSLISSDHLLRIVPKFRTMILLINQTYDYMNALLDDVYTKQISKLLASRLNNTYLDLRNEIQNIFESKMDIIYLKIDEFRYNILELIPEYFLNRLSNEIKSDYMKNTLGNDKIYNLLYYNFTDALKANLSSFLNEKIDLSYLKYNYNDKIQNNLSELKKILINYHYYISNRAATASHTYNMNSMSTIIMKYKDWVKQLNNLNLVFDFELTDTKKQSINELYNIIIPYLNKTNNDFIKLRSEQDSKMKKVVDNYKIGDLLPSVKQELEGSIIYSNIKVIKDNIIKLMDNLKTTIVEKFQKLNETLDKQFSNPLEGFNEKKKYRNLANYQTYNIYQVESPIQIIEQRYKNFRNEIIINENMTSVRTKKESFLSKLKNSIDHLDDTFNNYRKDISYFIDANDLIDEISRNSLNVKNYLKLYIIYLQKNITEFTDSVKGKINEGWDEIKEGIDNTLTKLFNYKFGTLFKNLNTYNKNIQNEKIEEKYLNEINTKDLVFLNDDKGDPLLTIDLMISSIDLSFNYSISLNNTYNFTVDISANVKVNAEIKLEVDEYYQSVIKGELGSGTIGFTPYYNLYDKSVDVNVYIFVDDTNYNNIYKIYDMNNEVWTMMKEKNIIEKGNSNMGFWKSFKTEEVKLNNS